MLYMKEMRAKVVAECTLKESAAINQILGRRVSFFFRFVFFFIFTFLVRITIIIVVFCFYLKKNIYNHLNRFKVSILVLPLHQP